ncbi:50S ribosomal protein L11 [Candidatus Bathyarchaeota archaeon]|jgi:large subunit ribosomal protein L11|nr:50S ribosomal protein L11 [Candidatus Bathyarchaeota archaeon]
MLEELQNIEVKKVGEKKQIESLINGGKATAGPPLGPALGPLGVNVLQIVNRINELTKSYAGMKVPVKVIVDVDTKDFEVEIGTPTTSALIIKELGIEKGSGTPNTEKVGNLSLEQTLKITEMKIKNTYAKDTKGALKEVLGTMVSMGVTIDNKDPREVQKEIDDNKHEALFKK